MDCSPPDSSVLGILQARILEWVAMPSFMGSSQPRDGTNASCIAGGFFTTSATWDALLEEKEGSLFLDGFIFQFVRQSKLFKNNHREGLLQSVVQWLGACIQSPIRELDPSGCN